MTSNWAAEQNSLINLHIPSTYRHTTNIYMQDCVYFSVSHVCLTCVLCSSLVFSFSFHPFKCDLLALWFFDSPIFPFFLHLSVHLSLLSGPMMGGRTDQWSMNKTKDSSMPDSFLGPLYFFQPLCVFFHLSWCSWDHSKSDFVGLS